MIEFPDKIDILKYDWMRAQFFQALIHPEFKSNIYYYSKEISNAGLCIENENLADRDSICNLYAMKKLYHSLRLKGYDKNFCKKEEYHINHNLRYYSGITIDINYNGNPVYYDGLKRLYYMIIQGNQSIVMEIRNKHPEWIKFVEEAYLINNKKYLYIKLPHPDFDSWGYARIENRDKRIIGFIENNIKSVLDIGSCSGSFLVGISSFIENGLGIDKSLPYCKIANWLKEKYNADNIEFINADCFQYEVKSKYDMISLLSTFHHIINVKGKELAMEWLKGLKNHCNYLLFEYPDKEEKILEILNIEAKEFAEQKDKIMSDIGYKQIEGFGIDESFKGTKREMLLYGVGR